MALTPRLEVRQAQSLTLTPQLMQSIKLLQLSHVELNAFVEAELERNPLLERAEAETPAETPDDSRADAPSDESFDAGTSETGAMDGDASPDDQAMGDQTFASETLGSETLGSDGLASAEAIAVDMDTDVSDMFPEQTGSDRGGQASGATGTSLRGDGGEDAPDLEAYLANRPHLADHLWAQATTMLVHNGDRMIARYLIDSLDDDGYLRVDLDEVAAQLGAEPADVEAVLAELQSCEPAGVFARSVAECLGLQLAEKDRLDPLMAALLQHLELVARHDLAGLARTIGAQTEDVIDMLGELRRLDPHPGRAFDPAPVQAVVPDVYVRQGPDGGWAVEVNSETLPRVLVNRTYFAQVSRHARNAGEKEFLVDCLQSASWLTKSLDQRAQTILKVATEIVKQQDGFFVSGVAHLKPMTLKMIADAIGMHESTVSRVTANKFMATPRGLLEMKYFFTTGLSSRAGGEDHSAEAVRHKIRQLIENETAEAVLSDDAIADILTKQDGVDIARRTVAKYREGMNISSSVVRRREKKARLQYV